MDEKGDENDREYSVTFSDGSKGVYPICSKFFEDTSNRFNFLGIIVNAAPLVVVLTSFTLRFLFITLVKYIGAPRFSREASTTMFSVLVVSFFNYGILYIVAPWNFEELGAE